MILDLKNLPNDTALLHQIITDLVDALTRERAELDLKKAELALIKAKLYGKSSEKLKKQAEELEQQIEEAESQLAQDLPNQAQDEPEDDQSDEESVSSTTPKNKPKRKKLPEHLERQEVMLNPDPKCASCGGEKFRTIGNDRSETLEYIPSSFKVISYTRPRCACRSCDTIVQSHPPSAAIDKGKAGPGLLAHIMVQKYCNHLPFYRQSQMYEREGIELSRSTMASWAGQISRLLKPVIEQLKIEIFASKVVHGDDTPIKVLAPGTGKTKTGRLWTYVRDGRNHGDQTPPAVCYFYSPDRKAERPASHLQGFSGVFQADAYGGYDQLYICDENNIAKILEAACWAHSRRKFYEVTVGTTNSNIAFRVLEQISEIYQIEEEIRGLGPDARKDARQARSKLLVVQLFADFKKSVTQLPAKSPTAKAINYCLNNQVALMRFLDDGRIEIDNNAAERAMRTVALGRKNWLFAGSDEGGETAADMYSLIETAKLNGINPWKDLATVLAVIQDYNSAKLSELLPWNIKLE
jgi:transposase